MNTISLELVRKLESLEGGDKFMYYRGDTGTVPNLLAEKINSLIEDKRITVVHRKVENGYFGVYEYWAVGL